MKKILKSDIAMWIILPIIILCIAIIRNHMYIKDDYEVKEKTDLVAEIQQSVENLEKNNPDFYIPYAYYMGYKKQGMLAEKIEIKNYEMSKDFRNIKYTLKNNYDFNIMITPELTDEVDNSYSAMQLLYYDFNSAYKILKPGEEVNLQINTTYIEREKVSKKEFKAHRLIYKCNEERDVVGYIQIGGNDWWPNLIKEL